MTSNIDAHDVLRAMHVHSDNINMFDRLYHMLVEFNSSVNVTSITGKLDVFVKHFADSLLPVDLLDKGCSVVDVGCGAGFPSIPLAIVRRDCRFVLLDSVRKKLMFASNIVVPSLGLDNIATMHTRVEDYKARESFDVGVSRAVAHMSTLVEYVLPFVRVGGYMIAYKSSDVDTELAEASNAITKLGGKLEDVLVREIPLVGIVRKLVVIRKIATTSSKYPRGQNKPRLEPIV